MHSLDSWKLRSGAQERGVETDSRWQDYEERGGKQVCDFGQTNINSVKKKSINATAKIVDEYAAYIIEVKSLCNFNVRCMILGSLL